MTTARTITHLRASARNDLWTHQDPTRICSCSSGTDRAAPQLIEGEHTAASGRRILSLAVVSHLMRHYQNGHGM